MLIIRWREVLVALSVFSGLVLICLCWYWNTAAEEQSYVHAEMDVCQRKTGLTNEELSHIHVFGYASKGMSNAAKCYRMCLVIFIESQLGPGAGDYVMTQLADELKKANCTNFDDIISEDM